MRSEREGQKMTTNWFNVGKIVNTHGVKGEVRVISVTDFEEERFQEGALLYFSYPGQEEVIPLTVKTHRLHKQFHLLQFEGYHSLNEVEPLKGGELKVAEDQLGALEENEYYHHDIIGCEVVTDEGEILGTVKEILSPGANDVWVVKQKGKGKDILIPYIEEVVTDVDIEKEKITVRLMEGLLPE